MCRPTCVFAAVNSNVKDNACLAYRPTGFTFEDPHFINCFTVNNKYESIKTQNGGGIYVILVNIFFENVMMAY